MKNNSLPTIKNLDVSNKIVLLRVDLNVPMLNGNVEDVTRITKIIPTIEYLIKQNSKIVIISHFDRPGGKFIDSMSLKPIVPYLSKALDYKEIIFVPECIGENTKKIINNLKNGEVALLENIRFYPGEEKNDHEFAQQLASMGEVFINDTFSCSHRAHASIVGLAKILPAAAGLLLEEELINIESRLTNPQRPFAAFVGGSKVSTKLDLLNTLIEKVDLLAIGGAMANTFLKAKNIEIGSSLYEQSLVDIAGEIIQKAINNNCKLILPEDVVTAKEIKEGIESKVVDVNKIDHNQMILDIGPKTIALLEQELKGIKTLVWNGPMGVCEYKPFDMGTVSLAKIVTKLTQSKCLESVAGGGDIISALTNANLANSFSYISTAGGAFLEWLEGKELPGIKVLKNNSSFVYS